MIVLRVSGSQWRAENKCERILGGEAAREPVASRMPAVFFSIEIQSPDATESHKRVDVELFRKQVRSASKGPARPRLRFGLP